MTSDDNTDREALAKVLGENIHVIRDNMGGGYDCDGCKARWDWNEKGWKDHADLKRADRIIAVLPSLGWVKAVDAARSVRDYLFMVQNDPKYGRDDAWVRMNSRPEWVAQKAIEGFPVPDTTKEPDQ